MTNSVTHRKPALILYMGMLVHWAVCLGPAPSYSGTDDTPISSVLMPAIPALDSIPSTPEGDRIRLGHNLIVTTQAYAKTFVGNALTCTNCHLDAGRKVGAGTYVGVIYAYPRYKARVAREISLEERINECFERSMNGKPLPEGSQEMTAIHAYMSWLSQEVSPSADLFWLGFPTLPLKERPDQHNGERLFQGTCATCHGADGHGTSVAPPLWGPQSFNIGSGLARVSKAAAFIKANMPITQPGILNESDAYDVAAFMNSHSRPDYAQKALDYPRGGKPADSPY
ncbi:MAG: c-type cytochrome [Nitrospirota bacterium]|nr:c-type cytochrome [Nitrospirota bacterium]